MVVLWHASGTDVAMVHPRFSAVPAFRTDGEVLHQGFVLFRIPQGGSDQQCQVEQKDGHMNSCRDINIEHGELGRVEQMGGSDHTDEQDDEQQGLGAAAELGLVFSLFVVVKHAVVGTGVPVVQHLDYCRELRTFRYLHGSLLPFVGQPPVGPFDQQPFHDGRATVQDCDVQRGLAVDVLLVDENLWLR